MKRAAPFFVLLLILSLALPASNQTPAPTPQKSSVARPSTRDEFRIENLGLKIPSLEVPAGCRIPQQRMKFFLDRLEKDVSSATKAAVIAFVDEREPGTTVAEAWDTAAALSALNLDPRAALWAELNALKTEWQPGFVTDAGVYLAYLELNDDARVFLNCALASGHRSPYLFEALANLYQQSGDSALARQHISQAKQMAPNDRLIDAEHSLINTGKPPTPKRQPDDMLDRAIEELKQHQERVLGVLAEAEEIQTQVDAVKGWQREAGDPGPTARLKQQYDESLKSMQPIFDDAKMTAAEFKQKNPGLPPNQYQQMRLLHRNNAFDLLIRAYFQATKDLLLRSWSITIEEGFNVHFWGEALGLDPLAYARLSEELDNYEFNGSNAAYTGNNLDSMTTAPFRARYKHEGHKRFERSV